MGNVKLLKYEAQFTEGDFYCTRWAYYSECDLVLEPMENMYVFCYHLF